ncbi:MAG: helix-turn-helix domain-containing protein [Pseudomonadota bacterium]
MSDKEDHLLNAAEQVFLRYGIKRTSMADVAEQAGVSRQTLYKSFANKDAVMLAGMQRHLAQKAQLIKAGLAAYDDVSDQIDVILNAVVVMPHAALTSSPHAAELMDGIGQISEAELARAAQKTTAFFAQVFAPFEAQLAGRGLTPADLASLAQIACKSIKGAAKDEADLKQLLATLKAALLASLSAV